MTTKTTYFNAHWQLFGWQKHAATAMWRWKKASGVHGIDTRPWSVRSSVAWQSVSRQWNPHLASAVPLPLPHHHHHRLLDSLAYSCPVALLPWVLSPHRRTCRSIITPTRRCQHASHANRCRPPRRLARLPSSWTAYSLRNTPPIVRTSAVPAALPENLPLPLAALRYQSYGRRHRHQT